MRDPKEARKTEDEIHSKAGRFETCKARPLGDSLPYAECLVRPAGYCPHRLSFGFSYYCHHPEWRQIVAQS